MKIDKAERASAKTKKKKWEEIMQEYEKKSERNEKLHIDGHKFISSGYLVSTLIKQSLYFILTYKH